MAYTGGVDLGGTKIQTVVVDAGGEVAGQSRRPTPTTGGPADVAAEIAFYLAQASDFVSQMDAGLDSPIAQGGTNVSGGQRQRLAIARAIVHQPRVLVFDDSFSALDLTTDARLRQALWRELPDVTKIVVAQRVSTITDADRIIVLDDGGIVGIGTHEQLLESSQTYREIVESQLGAEVAR